MAVAKWREKKNGGRITRDNIVSVIKYVIQDIKTDNKKNIFCHECDWNYEGNDFIAQFDLDEEIYPSKQHTKNEFDEFYVSYGKEVSAETALELIKKIADKYLGNEYQYLIAVHNDADHVHGHVVFNCKNLVTHTLFDTTTKHRIDALRNIVNEVSRENGLEVVPIRKEKNEFESITRGEWYARKNNRSYKQKIRNAIDDLIVNSKSYEDLILRLSQIMEVDTSGKYTKIRYPEAERFCRLQTLGSNYFEESLRYRIEHKDIPVAERTRLKYIATDTEKMQSNRGLRNWANRQNIDIAVNRMAAINEISKLLKQGSLRDQIDRLYEEIKTQETELKELNEEIKELQQAGPNAAERYRQLYIELIKPYTEMSDQKRKEAFKKAHYKEFKEYDRCKKILAKYRPEGSKKLPTASELSAISGQKEQDYFDQFRSLQDKNGQLEHLKSLIPLYKEIKDSNLIKNIESERERKNNTLESKIKRASSRVSTENNNGRKGESAR